ncbi:MAG: 4-hydroxy-tetrahydrodipicolinate reductase [Tissierellia bacterium]|nr:4-hydroxy-tetrahydrodipicolinate reductase [Tissierellia bacterium]
MDNLRIFITGITGAMGKALLETKEEDISIVGGIGEKVIKIKDKIPVFDKWKEVNIDFDLIIDFSAANKVSDWLDFALSTNTPILVATTGISKTTMEKMNKTALKIPVFYSQNMSYGIFVLKKLIQNAAILLEDYDIELIEAHHRYKKDSPSGTAYLLAKALQEIRDLEVVYDRSPKNECRNKKELGIFSVRGGTVPGDHSVLFLGEDEILELKHRAYSKKIFAKGAYKAGKWLVKQKPGFYSMEDMVKDG